jgi:hypothetical protein
MDRSMSGLDWYWQMPLEAGFTEVSLATGNFSRARVAAQRFLDVALTTADRTWQALGWRANARGAKAELDLTRAKQCLARALVTMEGFEVPLAEWQVHATAAEVFAESGESAAWERHRRLSRETILKIAKSLPEDNSLRRTFLGRRWSPGLLTAANLLTIGTSRDGRIRVDDYSTRRLRPPTSGPGAATLVPNKRTSSFNRSKR